MSSLTRLLTDGYEGALSIKRTTLIGRPDSFKYFDTEIFEKLLFKNVTCHPSTCLTGVLRFKLFNAWGILDFSIRRRGILC